jgi:phage terminase large subunit
MRDWDNILKFFGVDVDAVKNKTENIYQIGNSTVEFFGIEGSEAKAHGPRRDILFINECNRRVSYEEYDQLAGRTQEATFLDFNPYITGWLQERVMPNFKYELIHSTYLDNPYLPVSERESIESKRNKPGFEMWWKVYGLGELGSLEGAILPNWRYGEFDSSLPFGFGLDFGFSDPDAMVKVAIDKNKKIIYCDQKIYASGNSMEQLRQLIAYHCKRQDSIIADCADARAINEMVRYFNIKPVNKKRATVAEALKMMQDYEIVLTETSTELGKELNNYIWSDKRAEVPMQGNDHLIDALRYWFISNMNNRSESFQIWHMR